MAKDFHLKNKVRFITAASLFDGHDAAIHIMRRILQAEGAEVIHLGHDRSVADVVDAAIQEDVQGIAVSSYQGGHVEYFSYMMQLLKERGGGNIRVYGGGGGVISPEEIKLLHKRGVARIFTPADGQALGLEGMIRLMLKECDHPPGPPMESLPKNLSAVKPALIARALTTVESAHDPGQIAAVNRSRTKFRNSLTAESRKQPPKCPVVGITGTGGAGKSSLVDEILIRFLTAFPAKRVAVLCVDPSRRRTGGALLGDRLRVNSASSPRVYFRSMATRRAHASTSAAMRDALAVLKIARFDLILLETAGIGQSDSEVTEVADISTYVMTPEFGAPTQLEKIDMLDFADLVVLNKYDKSGAEDALREIRKAYQRNRKLFHITLNTLPVYPTCVHRFQDVGTNVFFNALFTQINGLPICDGRWEFTPLPAGEPMRGGLLPKDRINYLNQIVSTVRGYHADTNQHAQQARSAGHFFHALQELGDTVKPFQIIASKKSPSKSSPEIETLRSRYAQSLSALSPSLITELSDFAALQRSYHQTQQTYTVRDETIEVDNYTVSLSGLSIPKVCLPQSQDWGEQVEFLRSENTPGRFPFTAGVFPFKREGEDATRMFAGEGTAERTNARFHFVSRGQKAVRLSTAFDSVTLYGADPDNRPDIYGKVGNSGVSVCCLDDAKRLYSGFNLCAPTTSVSMTINGPAPILLAYYFNAAIDAECERRLKESGRWKKAQVRISKWFSERRCKPPRYRSAQLPEGHDGSGLGFLGLPADAVMDPKEYAAIKKEVLQKLRGTVQADILKEDQAQNTCIFSTDFSLRLMGDVEQYFIDHAVRNFYSVSISGYHIAEAGANPITQLALTLANGFTYVEYYRSRGMDLDHFAPNLSFFFSNGLDPEYSVIGRVARRIWAIAMKHLYGADERSQKLKYHIQTSGRSLHAREADFNDIRTTLQALLAITDNCNSLHTNAFDEAITTPTEASVRRAIAIQLIINRELGLTRNENPNQGGYFITELTRLVENEVLKIFEELDSRGGVLGAMEMNYQRSRIQEESMLYERKKLSGELPIIGINTFFNPASAHHDGPAELIRSTDEEKQSQVAQVHALQKTFTNERAQALARLHAAARGGSTSTTSGRVAASGGHAAKGGALNADQNLFAELMEAAKYCSLGTLSRALFAVGGAYRRNT